MTRPIIFCFDGSTDSKAAMAAAADLVALNAEAVVLTVWEPVDALIARTGAAVMSSDPDAQADDDGQQTEAANAARAGADAAAQHGFTVTTRVESAQQGIARQIIATADEIDARLLVCGRHGRGPIRTALLGSVSHDLIARAGRPVLIAPYGAAPSPNR